MKIGILTFHRAHNYGAVLQAYALQEILKKEGHDVEIIDYRQQYIERYKYLFLINKCFIKGSLYKSIRSTFYQIKNIPKKIIQKRNFIDFTNRNLNISKLISNNSKEIPNNYDLYIHGSDQIWNPKMFGGQYDPVFFGNYKVLSGKKISYAASFSFEELNNQSKQTFKHYLKNLDSISVREKELVSLISEFTSKTIYDVLDPTLVANINIWDKIAIKPKEKKYVLIYQVKYNKLTEQMAQKIASIKNLEILDINKYGNIPIGLYIGLFKNANYIITTSFHGTAFSIIFNKPFYSIALGSGSDMRIKSLLKKINLEMRFVNNIPKTINDLDYKEINKKLTTHKENSLNFLINSLNQ